MSIDLTGSTAGQYIDYGDATVVEGLTVKTVVLTIIQDSRIQAARPFELKNFASPNTNERFSILLDDNGLGSSRPGDFAVVVAFSTSIGIWHTNDAPLSTGSNFQIAITYDGGSTSNTPAMYSNGAARGVTKSSVGPSGTYISTGADHLIVGANNTFPAMDGRVHNALVYNRILSATEIAEAYTSRLVIPNFKGLVFAPILCGATGLQTFDGSTLAAGNTVKDSLSGLAGVPTGSPLGRGDNFLTF